MTLAVTNSTFTSNSAVDGGGIYNDSSGTATVKGSSFTGNSVSAGSRLRGVRLRGVRPSFKLT